MERIECQWCKEQNAPDRTHCHSCGAPLDAKDRVGEPASNAASMPPLPQWSYPPAPAPSYPYPAAAPPGWAGGFRAWQWLWVVIIFPVLFFVVPLATHHASRHSSVSPSSPFSPSRPSAVPTGGSLTVTAPNANETLACNDGTLTVTSVNVSATVTGHCARLAVLGQNNHVTVDAADVIDVGGIDNGVTYHSGSPQITNNGIDNTVQQG